MLLIKQFLLLLASILVTAQDVKENSAYLKNSEPISVILKYLNGEPSNYLYKEGRLIELKEKDDVLEVDTEVDITCKNSTPENPCTSDTLKCHSSMKKYPENSYLQIISMSCVPKEYGSDVDEIPSTEEENKIAEVAVTPELTHFVNGPCLGCPFDLNVDAEGVSNLVDTALKHVESERKEKHAMVRVLRLQQQVVAGIKYLLLIEIAPTTCSKDSTASPCPIDASKGTYICEIEYWEQPWLSKGKNIVRNNCTVSQEFLAKQPEKLSTESPVKDSDDDFLAELESQIVPESRFMNHGYYSYQNEIEEPSNNPEIVIPSFVLNQDIQWVLPESITPQRTTTAENDDDEIMHDMIRSKVRPDDPDSSSEEKQASPESDSSSEEKKESPESDSNSEERGRIERNARSSISSDSLKNSKSSKSSKSSESSESSKSSDEKKRDIRLRAKSSESSESLSSKNSNSSKSLKSSKSSISSDSSDSSDDNNRRTNKEKGIKENDVPLVEIKRKRSIGDMENLSQDEMKLLKKFAQKAVTNLGWDNVKPNIVRVTKGKIDGIYYSMRVKIEKTPVVKVCNILVHTEDDMSNPTLLKNVCADKRVRRGVPGGIVEIEKDNEQVKEFLKDGLLHLDSHSNHTNRYKIKEILSASTQVVSGQLLRVKARIVVSDCVKSTAGDATECGELEGVPSRVCNFKIWNQPWLKNGRKTEIVCENEDKTYSFRVRRRRDIASDKKPFMTGGITEVSRDHPKVKQLLKESLLDLDNNSPHKNRFKIQEILSASSQVVAGSLWRVKAKVILSDCEKGDDTDIEKCGELQDAQSNICNFRIWEQPWLKDGTKINITCDNEDKTHSLVRKTRSLQDLDEDQLMQEDFNILFQSFIETYRKTYLNELERDFRRKVFQKNMDTIHLLNRFEQGTAMYGVTQFADLTQEEFSKMHGLRKDLQSENDLPFPLAKIPNIDIPTAFDWRKKNAVTEVKDQGDCGSCWAFSTTGNVEGQYAIKYNKLQEFSEQELVDCDKLDEGCNGGLMDNAYRTIERIGGLESEKEYPYEAEDEKCHFNKSKAIVKLSGALNISHDEGDMAKWLVQNGPIAIAINANAMQFYMGGVSWPLSFLCNPKELDHGVLIVGYGIDNFPKFKKSLPFWIVKNSWGKSWGEQGYYRVYRGKGVCGLNQTPSSAVVA